MSTNNVPWWIALFAWMGISAYWHVCQIKELCDAPMVASTPASGTSDPLYIVDGNDLDLRSGGAIGFAKSEAVPNLSSVQPELDSLTSYLSQNQVKRLTIIGSYGSDETNSTSYPDLGIARAEAVKRYLVGNGLPDSLLTTNSQLMHFMDSDADTLFGGIEFKFRSVIPTTEEGLAKAEKYESIFKPMDLYFPSGKTDYIKTEANEQFLEEAMTYLAVNSDKKLLLTGHTDSDGEESRNINLSKIRAEEVKKQFVMKGIAASQLLTDAKGESQPKESNDTPEGRRANRRVTIVVH